MAKATTLDRADTTVADMLVTHSVPAYISHFKGKEVLASLWWPASSLNIPKQRPRGPVHRHGPGQQDLFPVQRSRGQPAGSDAGRKH
jgi:hypothetical protein